MKPLRSSERIALSASGSALRQIGGRKRTPFQHAQDLRHGIVGRGIEQQAGARRRGRSRSATRPCRAGSPTPAAACRAALRPAARSNSPRSSGPAPAVRASSTGSESISRSASRAAIGGGVVVAAQDHAGQLARAERHHDAAARLHAVPQRLRQRVGEWLVERHRQADVAIEVRSLGHEPFRIRHRAPPGGMGAIISPSIRIFVGSPIGAWFSSALSATVSTYVVRFLPKLAEFESAAGCRSKFRNDDKLLEFEAQRDDLFAERRQVVLVAVARLLDQPVGAKPE